MLTTGSKVIHIMGPPAVAMGIPVTFTCRRMHTLDSIAWTIYYTNASGSTQSVSTLLGVDLMSTVANFTTVNESISELVLNTTNINITSIECNVRDGSGMTRVSSINVTVYGKLLFLRFIV